MFLVQESTQTVQQPIRARIGLYANKPFAIRACHHSLWTLLCVYRLLGHQHDFSSLERIRQKPQNTPEWISVNMSIPLGSPFTFGNITVLLIKQP